MSAVIWTVAIGIFVILAARCFTAKAQARERRQCTKHVITYGAFGGPDHLEWVYGPHRTQGNACDGPEHQRKTAWW